MTITKVVNLNKNPCDVRIDRGSMFGNPFKIGVHGNRSEVIEQFKNYFYSKLRDEPEFAEEVLKLKGKTLGCHCHPKPCHGEIICDYLNSIIDKQHPFAILLDDEKHS